MTLPDRETLLAIGISLIMGGVVLRGFAASARRDLARRKEHRIDARKSTDAYLTDEFARPSGWFERRLSVIANIILTTGAVLTVAWFIRN